jgi:hypothetical protein
MCVRSRRSRHVSNYVSQLSRRYFCLLSRHCLLAKACRFSFQFCCWYGCLKACNSSWTYWISFCRCSWLWWLYIMILGSVFRLFFFRFRSEIGSVCWHVHSSQIWAASYLFSYLTWASLFVGLYMHLMLDIFCSPAYGFSVSKFVPCVVHL